LDLRRQVRPERAVGVGEPAAEVDDEHGRARSERDALAEPGPRIDLPGFLVGHASTASRPAARSSSPKRARLTKRPAPGCPTSSSFSTITWPRTSTAA